jgi:hypothetical protein
MKFFLSLFILIIFIQGHITLAAPFSGTMSYEYSKQAGQEKKFSPDVTINLNCPLTNQLSFTGTFESNRTNNQPTTNTINNAYFAYHHANIDYIIGKQSYTLSNGLIASMNGIDGMQAQFAVKNNTANFFYGQDDIHLLAVNFTLNNLGKHQDFALETNYFQDDNQYIGITASKQLTKNTFLTIETAKNLTTTAAGYLITLKYGTTQQVGDIDISLSYRNIKQGAVSAYCVDSYYDHSKGFRIIFNKNLSKNMTLNAYRDLAAKQDYTAINTTALTLSSNF